MINKVFGTILGTLAIILWFMPMNYVSMMGMDMYQAGNHLGGIAYVVLACSFAYALMSWTTLHIPRIIVSVVATLVCLLMLAMLVDTFAWGLVAMTITSAISAILASWDAFKSPVSTTMS